MAEPLLETLLPLAPPAPSALATRGLTVRVDGRVLLRHIDLAVPAASVIAIIGPSGAGKTTLLRTLNRMVELQPGVSWSGEVLFRGQPGASLDADALRARVGMLFQQPVVFPCSVAENVLFGVRHLPKAKRPARADWSLVAERALVGVGLWNEVKDRLREPAIRLSLGQQQRLCLARTLAVGPEVILMDEPTSALDPRSSEAIEELILRLKRDHAIVLVTHNLAQAQRLADEVACLCVRDGAGELLETACCDQVFANPRCREVAEFLRRELP
jgi:phosphate transport system ATP-binding protein